MSNPAAFPALGRHGEYDWLVTDKSLPELLQLCPEIILGKYLAITSCDSGPLELNDEERLSGWESRHGIAYSPRIGAIEGLPHDGWDEWYVFQRSADLGQLVPATTNIFEVPQRPGYVHAFVNFGTFPLRRPQGNTLLDLFWPQLDWIHPESYIGNGEYLMLATVNEKLFASARKVLT